MNKKNIVTQVAPVPVQTSPVLTSAQKLWEEIKNKQLDIFGLPNQVISQYCKPVEVDGVRLFVTFTVQAFLPALEDTLGVTFNVERSDKYLIITKK